MKPRTQQAIFLVTCPVIHTESNSYVNSIVLIDDQILFILMT